MSQFSRESGPFEERRLAEAVGEYIALSAESQTEERFTALALDIFAYQYEHSAPIRALCDSLGATPGRVRDLADIPAIPAAAYKRFELSCAALEDIVSVFYSSGTTGQERSAHLMSTASLGLYEVSLRAGFFRRFPDVPEIWALMEPASSATHSSLSHMLSALRAARWFWNDIPSLENALDHSKRPVTLFGTAFAFVDLFDNAQGSWRLPPGSRIIETGGFKGRTREVSRTELYALFADRFGVPDDHCHGEYGMSEMSSQFYSTGAAGPFSGPPWVKTRTIDPLTGKDAREAGLLCHYDLANLNSAMAIQTQDIGLPCDGGFTLLGRAQGAELRGCSLTVEELWNLRPRPR